MLGNCSHRLLLFLAFFSVLSPLAQRTLLETLSRVLERKAALQYFHAPTEKQMGFREIYGKQKRLPSAITLSRTPASSIGENKSSSRPILSFKTFRLFLYISKERTPHYFFCFIFLGVRVIPLFRSRRKETREMWGSWKNKKGLWLTETTERASELLFRLLPPSNISRETTFEDTEKTIVNNRVKFCHFFVSFLKEPKGNNRGVFRLRWCLLQFWVFFLLFEFFPFIPGTAEPLSISTAPVGVTRRRKRTPGPRRRKLNKKSGRSP